MEEYSHSILDYQAEQPCHLIFEIPKWLFADLCRIQAVQGRPLQSLLVEQLENFVTDNWDLSSDSPRKEGWNE